MTHNPEPKGLRQMQLTFDAADIAQIDKILTELGHPKITMGEISLLTGGSGSNRQGGSWRSIARRFIAARKTTE